MLSLSRFTKIVVNVILIPLVATCGTVTLQALSENKTQ